MSEVSFNITQSEEKGTQIIVYIDGKSYIAGENHPSFSSILDACRNSDFDELATLFDVQSSIITKLERLSDRIQIGNGIVYFDGQPLFTRLTEVLVENWRAQKTFRPFVNFLENIMQNPSRNSREQLYTFLENNKFAITEDGHFLAYKAVANNYESITAGYGIVNGVIFEHANLPNTVGAVVEMNRERVVDDPSTACAEGLHVGTYSFASQFSCGTGHILLVKVNPRDVVSVPVDSEFQKVRVCRYQVIRPVVDSLSESVYDKDGLPNSNWTYDESKYDKDYAFALDTLEHEARRYTYKGRVANSYQELATRLGFSKSVANYFDSLHPAKAVYRYHIFRLRK